MPRLKRVFEGKTRYWSMTMESPNPLMLARLRLEFFAEAAIATECKFTYEIYIKESPVRTAFRKHLPEFMEFYRIPPTIK